MTDIQSEKYFGGRKNLVRHESLVPKKCKEFLKKTSKKTGLSESVITTAALHHYQQYLQS